MSLKKNLILITLLLMGFAHFAQPVINVESEDVEMNKAIKEAKETFSQFDKAFKSKNSRYSFFSIKIKFAAPGGSAEHIWLSDITFRNNKYYGVVDNTPQTTKEVKEGQKIEIDPSKISDWLYLDDGILKGGYTIQVLNKRVPKEGD